MNIYDQIAEKWKEPTNRQSIEIECACYLYDFIQKSSICTVIETGICQGFSSWVFLKALESVGGHLHSIDPNLYSLKKMVVEPSFYPRWHVYRHKSCEILADIFSAFSPASVLFWHDSDHSYENQKAEFVCALNKARYIGAHNIDMSNAWDEIITPNYLKVAREKSHRNWWGLSVQPYNGIYLEKEQVR